MSMISKQIDDLRAYAKDRKGELAKLVSDAADTIETLSAKLSAANMERSERYYHGDWIPCSERLPEEDQEVLATTNWGDVTYAWRYDNNKWFIHEGNTNATTDDILAWMPMPEPYKGGEQNGKA